MTSSDKLTFLKSIFGDGHFHSSSKELLVKCVFCSHHKKKLSINLETDENQCWVCGKASKSLFPLLKQIKAPPSQFSEYIKKHKANTVKHFSKKDDDFYISLPKEYEPLVNLKNSLYCKRVFSYLLESRKIEEEDILKHKLGYCFDGIYKDRIIMPSFTKEGNLNFFTGRDVSNESRTPYLNEEVPKNYKNSIIINELNVDFSKPVVLVEGFFDLLKSTNNTVALFGSSLSDESLLFQTLIQHNSEIILALDPDAKKKILKIAKDMLSFDLSVYFADLSPYKDLGEMPKSEAKIRIESAEKVNERFLFKNKIEQMKYD